jgi:patatin-like phospholipase/acyl hydrolase
LDDAGFFDLKDKYAQKGTGSEFGYERGFKFTKHSNDALRASINAVLGNNKISDLKARTMITAVNLSNGRAQFFKTQHNSRYIVDSKRLLVDVALATSAAPLYLPMHAFDDQIFVDGGLVGNNPGLFALSEVEENIEGISSDLDIHMMSIGALSQSFSMPTNTQVNVGIKGWAKNLIPLMMSCQENMTTSLLSMRMKNNFHHIDGDLTAAQATEVALDKATLESSTIIKSIADNSVRENVTKPFVVEFFAHKAPLPTFFNQPS